MNFPENSKMGPESELPSFKSERGIAPGLTSYNPTTLILHMLPGSAMA